MGSLLLSFMADAWLDGGREEMTRQQIEQYELESILRAGFSFPPRGGDDTAQQIISNSERRRAKTKQQKEGAAT